MGKLKSLISLIFVVSLTVLLQPGQAFAWGPLTHVYLGSELLLMGSALPAALYQLLLRRREDFLYGNIMADTIIAKRFVPKERNSHNWLTGLALLEASQEDHERAFSLGYLCHLAADTVAHGDFTAGQRNLTHAFHEYRADSVLHKDYWDETLAISQKVHRRNDRFLKQHLDLVMLNFSANKNIFKGFVALTGMTPSPIGSVMDWRLKRTGMKEQIDLYHQDSLARMIDILQHGEDSDVLLCDPMAKLKGDKLMKRIFAK